MALRLDKVHELVVGLRLSHDALYAEYDICILGFSCIHGS